MRFLSIILITIFTVLLTACSSQPTPQGFSPPVVPVLAEEARLEDVPLFFESLGTLKPAVWVDIRPQVSGMLQKAHFLEGQHVKKGDILFTIDPQAYAIRLQETEAQLAQNRAALDVASKKLNRYNNLSSKDLIPQQEWDELRSQVSKSEAQVLADEAKVASALLDLERCNITAPIEGRTGAIAIHPGNLVAASQAAPLVSLANTENLVVEFTLTEREYQQLTPEKAQGKYSVEISPFCDETKKANATLSFLDNSFDPQTGLLYMRALLPNERQLFLPGQHVKVRVPINVMHDALLISQKAVKINQQGPYVFVVKEDDTAEMRPVKLGDEVGSQVVVLEGLAPKEKVVTEGHLRLAPGLKVEIKTDSGK